MKPKVKTDRTKIVSTTVSLKIIPMHMGDIVECEQCENIIKFEGQKQKALWVVVNVYRKSGRCYTTFYHPDHYLAAGEPHGPWQDKTDEKPTNAVIPPSRRRDVA